MPPVRPLRGLGYALDRYGSREIPERVRRPGEAAEHPGRIADLTDVVSPPYDVIGDSQRSVLLARDPHNAVRLELSAETAPHRAAAEALAAWKTDGTLARRSKAALYAYRYPSPDDPSGAGGARHPGPHAPGAVGPDHPSPRAHHARPQGRATRLAAGHPTPSSVRSWCSTPMPPRTRMRRSPSPRSTSGARATGTGSSTGSRSSSATPAWRPTCPVAGWSWPTATIGTKPPSPTRPRCGPPAIGRDAAPGSLGPDWIMVVLVNAATEPLVIRPTHRLLRTVDPVRLRALVQGPDPLFQAVPVAPEALADRLADLRDAEEAVFGLVLPDGEGWLIVGDVDAAADRMRRETTISAPVRRLGPGDPARRAPGRPAGHHPRRPWPRGRRSSTLGARPMPAVESPRRGRGRDPGPTHPAGGAGRGGRCRRRDAAEIDVLLSQAADRHGLPSAGGLSDRGPGDQARRGLHRARGHPRRDPPARAAQPQAPTPARPRRPDRIVAVGRLRGLLRRARAGRRTP